jgi:AcrR family transcriptional regulator
MPSQRGTVSHSGRNSNADVLDAALHILDTHGIADLTMRRLAAALDVQPSALYWHFPNKQSLLAALSDRIVERARPEVSADSDWSTITRAEASSLRDALLTYRDGAELVSSTIALGLGARAPLERLTTAVSHGGFDDRASRMAASALLHFVLGHVWHEQQRMQYDSLGLVERGIEPAQSMVPNEGASFQFGIGLLIRGMNTITVAST